MTRVAINGFGRIGRQSLKAMLEYYPDDLEIVAINDLSDLETLAHLLRYDSTYGTFDGEIAVFENQLAIDYEDTHLDIEALAERDPARLPWRALDIDVVIEASGRFTDATQARAHLDAGARKVIISAPARGEDITICMGVNHGRYDPIAHHVISNASCTTNCLAPVAKVLNDRFGIERGLMTTIHSYTMDQNLHDTIHKDLRRARAAAINLVPTTTGAAQAVALVIPELKGKFSGYAIRVPTPTVSIIDFTVQLAHGASVEEVNNAFIAASESVELENILAATEEELVSSDYIGNPYSSTVDLKLTAQVGDNLFKVVAWYDNEWGYSVRVADLAAFVADNMEE
jgi:glyceraldehyde 3-phosphate dehydrogenase